MSFILAQGEPGVPTEEVCDRIQDRTGLMALSQSGFMWRTITYYMKRTGIPVNFGITVLLGFIIGAAIAGPDVLPVHARQSQTIRRPQGDGRDQLAHRRHGAGAGGGGRRARLRASASAWRSVLEDILMWRIKGVPPAMFMAWPIPVGTAVAAAVIVAGSALVSLRRVLTLEPASVFR